MSLDTAGQLLAEAPEVCSCEQALGASAEPALDVGTATGAEDEPLRTPQRAAAPSAAALQQPPASEDGSDVTAPTPGSDVGRLSIDVSHSAPSQLGGGPLSPCKSWVRRTERRADELRRQFGLDEDEPLVDDFMCALRKRILLQGRMFLFARHICFNSNLFGYHKTKVIPLDKVVDVRKKKTAGFPNSIEITLASGKREFFASLLARGEAYRLIVEQWRQCNPEAPSPPSPRATAESAEPLSLTRRRNSMQHIIRSFGSLVSRDGGGANGSEAPAGSTDGGDRAGGSTLQSVDEEGALAGSRAGRGDSQLPASPFASAARQGSPIGGSPPGLSSLPEGGEASLGFGVGPGDDSFVVRSPPSVAALGGGRTELEFTQLTDQQCQRALDAEFGGSREAAPAFDPDMQLVLEFELPCPPPEVFHRFLSNGSTFPHEFHTARGDSNIRLSKWSRHYKVGLVRDLQFVTPVKARIGPPQAMCHQTQRLQVFAGRHLVLETSQVMTGIPYSDCFSVETRWDVVPVGPTTPAGASPAAAAPASPTAGSPAAGSAAPDSGSAHSGGGSSRVTVRLKVPFSKKTMWRSFIEKGTVESTLESMQKWQQMASEKLAAEPAQRLVRSTTAEAEWTALFGGRGSAPAHHRRHSRAGSVSQGIPVGRQAMLVRHRRSPSRPYDLSAAASGAGSGLPAARSPSHTSLAKQASHGSLKQQGSQAPSSCPSPSSRLAHGSVADLQQELLQQGPPGAALPQQGTPARATGPSPLRAIAAVVAALLGALLYVPRSMCRAVGALSSGQLVVCAIGCGIMAMQAALFLQQRQQFEQLQAHHAATQLAHVQAAPAGGDASDSAQFVAAQGAAVAALSTRLASLQQAVETLQAHSQGWQAQVDALAQAAAALAAHLQQPR